MNLAFVLQRWGPHGGTGRFACGLADWLVGQGHDVHVYCQRLSGDPGGVSVHRLPAGSMVKAARTVPLSAHDVVTGLGRTAPHDVYRAGGGAHGAWLGMRHPGVIGRLRRAISPVIRRELQLERMAVESARVVVANSRMAAADLRAAYDIDAHVIRNGVDLDRFRPDEELRVRQRSRWKVPANGRVVLFLGHGFRRKGLSTAVAAFASFAGPDDRLVVAGRDQRAWTYRLRARQRLGPRLIWLGAVDAPETVYAAADVSLLPTRYDAAANSVLEAMACGVPTVTSRRDGNAEIVADSSLVVDNPHDADGFAAAARYALATPSLSAASRDAAQAWPVSRNGLAMEALYRNLLHA